ncbi:procathepsin L-like [Helicoverpa zea]|uniref:procathepsin L-like n=1 Tax=Helicoverpa zea TaxID=7113 RepID=UPI001F57D71C|nr:procathepsin L-like [Helicoverpa zea]
MYILKLIFILQLVQINGMQITDTPNKIRSISTKHEDNRQTRCLGSQASNLVSQTVDFFQKTEVLSDILKGLNVTQCSIDKSAEYIRKHILNGLIVHPDLPDWHWHEYKSVHKKAYATPHQELDALSKWRNNLRIVAQHNRDFLLGKQSYSLHLNFFGDLDVKEYFNKFLKLFRTFSLFDPAEDPHKTAYRKALHRTVPESFDWRSKGFKPKLEEQHHCGACYAFAVTHALQAQLYKQHGFWGELSPQQILDCSFKDGNAGCDGGSLRGALRYAARDGLIKESQYPYVGQDGKCKYNSQLVRARPRRWATLPMGDEAAMEQTLATIGPLAVAVNAAPFTFQLYRSGIYDDLFCSPWQLNHAMLLVGYTPDYWILLNWWGKNWGEDGYIRIRRGLNRCGVANMATYVEL